MAAGRNFPVFPSETASVFKAAIYVISPDDQGLEKILLPMNNVTNCAFGGKNLKTMYITCQHKIWSVETKTGGQGLR